MLSYRALFRLLIKHGPTIVRIVRQIMAMLETMRNEGRISESGCFSYRCRVEHELASLEDAPLRKPEATRRLKALRDEMIADRARSRR